MTLGAVWVMAFVYAFVAGATALRPQDALNGWGHAIAVFMGWQAIAGLIAVALFGVGIGWQKGSSTRRLSRVPLWIALAQVAIFGVALAWSLVE